MPLPQWLQRLFAALGRTPSTVAFTDYQSFRGVDDFASIRELSRLIDSDSAASLSPGCFENTEFAMILGNVFRAQGHIEKAVRLRESLLDRPDPGREDRALINYELGADYRKAGLYDRALAAYKEARRLGYAEATLSRELALLAADSGDFETAAEEAAKGGNSRAEASYLVRLAEEQASLGNDAGAVSLIKRALRIYPGSPEAWLRLACINLLGGDVRNACLRVHSAIPLADASGRLLLLEGLYAFLRGQAAPEISPEAMASFAEDLCAFLKQWDGDVILCYYAGLFLQAGRNYSEAEQWFTKALVLDPDFWAARLAILSLAAGREQLPLLLSQQIDFFVNQGNRARRFRCGSCGMRRDTIFSFCPRCHSWHTAEFRLRIT